MKFKELEKAVNLIRGIIILPSLGTSKKKNKKPTVTEVWTRDAILKAFENHEKNIINKRKGGDSGRRGL